MLKKIYFVVPCYNETEVLEITAERLHEKVETLIEKNYSSGESYSVCR